MWLAIILGGLLGLFAGFWPDDGPSMSGVQYERAMEQITEGVEEMGEMQREHDRRMQEILDD